LTLAERRVHRLRDRAREVERARVAAIALEDALRTATMPGTSDARIVLIRRLDLGRVPRAVAPSTLALALEAAVLRLAPGAVHAESPGAGDAAMVYFNDDSEALLAMTRRIAVGGDASEWFWPLVVRGWSRSMPVHAAAMLLVANALATTPRVVAVAHVVETFVQLGATDVLLAPMSEHQAESLMVECGVPLDGSRGALPLHLAPRLSATAHRAIREWVKRLPGGVTDVRVKWLTAMLLIAERPSRAASHALPEMVERVLGSVVRQPRSDEQPTPARALDDGGEPARDGSVDHEMEWWQWARHRPVDSDVGGGPPASPARSRPARPPVYSPERTPPDLADFEIVEPPAPDPPHWLAPRATDFGGLLFLIPLLSRLGITALLAERPALDETGWPERLLWHVAARLGIADDDAAIAWLRRDRAILPEDRAITATTIRRMRQYARRDARQSLRRLVARPAIVAATRTHIDLLMHHSQVDVAVRLAGLDVDPGWVPWLGRVVQFHYLDVLPDVSA
jgi:hypothetical protein